MTCNECPICMDDITETNCVVTECGHHFHTSCLMKNAAHNGFGCPYCRSVLAEVPEEDESESSEEEEEEEELYSDASLTSMRMLFSRVQNEEVEEEPEEEEEEQEEEEYPIPTPEVIEQKLLEQGVTMLDMIKCMLAINHEEYESEDEYQTKEDEVFGKMSIIISNYREPVPLEPVQEPVPLPIVVEPVLEPLPVQRPIPFPYWSEVVTFTIDEQMDFKAQPKERTKRNHRQQDSREQDDHIEIVIVA